MIRKTSKILLVLMLISIVVEIGSLTMSEYVTKNDINEKIHHFSKDLQLRLPLNENDNYLSSPISIWFLLSMISNGSMRNTRDQILWALYSDRFKNDGIRWMDENFIKRHSSLFASQESYSFQLNMANMIFVNDFWDLQIPFFDSIKRENRSTIDAINFANVKNASKAINHWSNYHTQGQINQFFVPGDLGSDFGLVLTSAISFKAVWKVKYNRSYSESHFLYNLNGHLKNIPVINVHNTWKYGRVPHGSAEYIVVPLNDGKFNMILILPDLGVNLQWIAEDVKTLNPSYFSGGKRRDIILQIPKINFTTTINLEKPLRNLGMNDMFTNDAAFNITTSKSRVKIDKFVQKLSLIIDEQEYKPSDTFIMNMTNPVIFKINRPFFVIISTGETVLFSGKIGDPTMKGNFL